MLHAGRSSQHFKLALLPNWASGKESAMGGFRALPKASKCGSTVNLHNLSISAPSALNLDRCSTWALKPQVLLCYRPQSRPHFLRQVAVV